MDFFDRKNPKEYPRYFEGFSGQKNSKVDVKSDAQVRILKSDGSIPVTLAQRRILKCNEYKQDTLNLLAADNGRPGAKAPAVLQLLTNDATRTVAIFMVKPINN